MTKQPEDYLYEYVIEMDGRELAIYFSDAAPPPIGSLLAPIEFVPEGNDQYRVVNLLIQPKNIDGSEVSEQTYVCVVVEKARD